MFERRSNQGGRWQQVRTQRTTMGADDGMLRIHCALLLSLLTSLSIAGPRSIASFDGDWKFVQGDVSGAEQIAFADQAWTEIDLPHDWSIAGPFDEFAPAGGAGAFLPTGVAWYRRSFNLPEPRGAQRVFIEFDGVMERSGVWINGAHVGHRPNGYASFRYELTPHLRFGPGEAYANVLAVRADTHAQPASRWYAGSGIYRHVRLITTGVVHIEQSGTFVTTPTLDADSATVRVESSVLNQSQSDRDAQIEVTIIAPDGKSVATTRGATQVLPAGRAVTLYAETKLARPRRWDIADPALYRAAVRIVTKDDLLDEETVTFGIRDARFEAATGFWLNGRNLKLKGAALHADAGAFGMAAPLAFWERRLKGLQALGVNAIRTAHHPFSPEVLDLCDRLGLLVMNEAFDMWTVAKNPHDYHLFFNDWSSEDTRAFVRRDRNHPSVVIWSAGNEIHDTPYPLVAKSILKRLVNEFHENDPTRPVTLALFRPNTTGDYQNGLADMLDVVGQNYRETELAAAHAQNPLRKIVGTENGKTRASWLVVRDHPAFAGMFLWTGADYLGEADRAGWPAISRHTGLVDRIDNVHVVGLERASWWSDRPVVHIARRLIEPVDTSALPTTTNVAMPAPAGPAAAADWTPTDLSPHEETVEVYSNAPEVELRVNGRTLGRLPRNADDSPRSWKVTFEPGHVQAIAYDGNKKVGEETLHTAGKPAKLRLIGEQRSIEPGFDHVGFVRVEVTDVNGVVVPSATNLLSATLAGGGVLAAFDNGDVTDHTPFTSTQRKARNGRALIMLRATNTGAPIRLQITSDGLQSASLSLPVVRPSLP
jgi:beta-galactosidase